MSRQRTVRSILSLVALGAALTFVFGRSTHLRAQSPAANLTYPPDGATNVDLSQPIQWTSVAGAQAYYLYVGTIPGAKDVVDTGETQQTSYRASNLPFARTLYARIWTKSAGVWRFQDSTFSSLPAAITYPANGASGADTSQAIQWTAVPNAQAYYLYLGTTAGAKDLANTGELLQTSYLAANLPAAQTLYARIWTKFAGHWWFSDSTFSAAASPPVTATIVVPANGAVNANPEQSLQWTTVTNAQAYYLYVGSSVGARDLIDSGEIHETSYPAGSLARWQPVYARLWTKFAGIWRYTDSTFSFAAAAPALIYPANGAVAIDQLQPAAWTTVANADGYSLNIGSAPGAKDLLDSGEIHLAALPLPRLPAGPTLYARIWARFGDNWVYRDSTFTASPIAAVFIYPTDSSTGVDGLQPIRWTAPSGTLSRRLLVGTTPGAGDLFDSGLILVDSVLVPNMPATGVLYARALVNVAGAWRHTDVAFTRAPAVSTPIMVDPVNGEAHFSTSRPFTWEEAPLARGYHLTIGTAPGRNDLHDSGEITVTRRFVPNLPPGSWYGQLQAKINGTWRSTDFTFHVDDAAITTALQIENALLATDAVRRMALTDNRPLSWTALAARTAPRFIANCADFAQTLLGVLAEMNIQIPNRRLDIAFNPNNYEQHTLVEAFDAATARWMLLDPTFDLTVRRAADSSWADADDVSAATRAERWSDVTYMFLGSLGNAYAKSYYLDYPLLFVNVYHEGQVTVYGQGAPLLDYVTEVAMPVNSVYTMYVAGCTSGQVTTVLRRNGTDITLTCDGVDGLSTVFGANTVARTAQTADSVKLYRLQRFVF